MARQNGCPWDSWTCVMAEGIATWRYLNGRVRMVAPGILVWRTRRRRRRLLNHDYTKQIFLHITQAAHECAIGQGEKQSLTPGCRHAWDENFHPPTSTISTTSQVNKAGSALQGDSWIHRGVVIALRDPSFRWLLRGLPETISKKTLTHQ